MSIAGLLAGLALWPFPASGAADGRVGALPQVGVADDDAHVCAEGLARGGVILTVRAADADGDQIDSIHRCARAAENTAQMVGLCEHLSPAFLRRWDFFDGEEHSAE